MSYFKIGVNCADGVNPEASAGWQRYRSLPVPIVVAAVDGAGPVYEAQQRNNPADVLLFRLHERDGVKIEDCQYDTDPVQFADFRMGQILRYWPTELDRARVWTTPINEPSKEPTETAWLAAFNLRMAQLCLSNGFRMLGFGWAGGTPEPAFWLHPQNIEFLRLCAANPDRLGVNLHEYSYTDDLTDKFPYLLGRFQQLHAICDDYGLAHPTILMGEFGWRQDYISLEEPAFRQQTAWAQELYGRFPNIIGAATWTLGKWQGTVATDLARLLPGLCDMAVNYVPEPQPGRGAPRQQYARVYWVLPADVDEATYTAVAQQARTESLRTVGFSYDDAGIGDLDSRTAVLWGIDDLDRQVFREWYALNYPGVRVEFRDLPGTTPPPFTFTHWPTGYKSITQPFGANPDYYAQFGLPGHEGVDMRAPHGSPIYAVADGRVYRIETVEASGGNYGIQVRIEHPGGYRTVYAHLLDTAVAVGDVVQGGDVIGRADNTGNSFGDHLHLTLKSDRAFPGGTEYQGYPSNIIDPTPYLLPLLDAPPPPDYSYGGKPVTYRAVIHGPASDWMWNMPDLRDMLSALAMPVKYLSNGINADWFQAQPWHMVRVFWQPHEKKTPAQCWQDVGGDLVKLYQRGARRFELLNEPNLTSEGLGVVWANGREFGAWLREFIFILRSQIPEAQLYFPGMSPGEPWTNQFAFTNEAWPQVRELCAGFCLHAYTGTTDNQETAVAEIVSQVREAQRYLRLNVPLVVSEMSVNRKASAAYRAAVYRQVDAQLAAIPGVEAGCWFISHWDAAMDQYGERWLGTDLPRLYRA